MNDAACPVMNRLGAQRPHAPPEAVPDILTRDVGGAHAEGGPFLPTLHPHVIGYRSRIFILRELQARIAAKGDCRIATHADIARPSADAAGLKGQR